MLGQFSEAVAALETATTLIPLNCFAQCALADGYARLGKRKLASFLYRRLLKEKQCPSSLLPAVAAGAGAIGDHACALNVCRQLVRREADHHAALFGIAYYMEKLDYHPEEILHWVKSAFRLRPQSVTYRLSYASTLEYLGRLPAARELLVDIKLDCIHCSRILGRMSEIFSKAGDSENAHRCQCRLESLRSQRST
jgi:tetratricopeptide (TPR) repeat protein